MKLLSQLRKYWEFRRTLSQLLSKPLSLADCETILRERLARREENLLYLMEHAVFENPHSPYLPLLRDTGITFEDVRKSVQQKGVEGTLTVLRDAGIYLTFEEYKGRQPLVRHGKTYSVTPESFVNHLQRESFFHAHSTGGSTGTAVNVPQNLHYERDHSVHTGIMFALWMPPETAVCLWHSEPPIASLGALVRFSLLGYPPVAWFTPFPKGSMHESWRSRFLLRTTLQLARKRGFPLPDPQYVPLTEAHRIAEWIVEQKRSGSTCMIQCNVSNAVRICEAARRRKLDICSTRFFMLSEPLTEAKREEIVAAGGVPLSVYSAVDAGRLAMPCENPAYADDMHVSSDCVAIITRRRIRPGSEEPVDAFLITTLMHTNPLFLLNVEFDDFGVLEERNCGCRVAKLGFQPHIGKVRSFAKLTTQGTTVPLADVACIIEKTLPQRFGGASIHYQLLEEDLGSQTRLTLVISPQVGPVNERAVIQTFLRELRRADAHLVEPTRLWEESGALRVVRAEPIVTPRGKLMPVRVLRDYERSQLPL